MDAFRMESTSPEVVECALRDEEKTLTLEKVFWSRFTPNLVPATWIIGILLVTIGLDFGMGLLAILIGNIIGSVPVALVGLMGPRTGLPQIEASKLSFGKSGARIPALLNWVACVGWDAINNVPSTLALVSFSLLAGLILPFWAALAMLVAIQLFVSIYGHNLVQTVQKYLGYVLLVGFTITCIASILHGGTVLRSNTPLTISKFVSAVAIVASYNLGWAPYSSDYTRYLPRETPSYKIFWRILSALMLSAVSLELCGLITAYYIQDPTPDAVIGSLARLAVPLALIALFSVGISAIAQNAMNDNTGAYSLISAGVPVSRPISATISAALGFALAFYGKGQYALLYQNYLIVLMYWVAPWIAIVLAHWFLLRQHSVERNGHSWSGAAWIFLITSALTIFLFSSTPLYVGPIAKLMGGVDIGYLVGFIAAGALYVVVYAGGRRTVDL